MRSSPNRAVVPDSQSPVMVRSAARSRGEDSATARHRSGLSRPELRAKSWLANRARRRSAMVVASCSAWTWRERPMTQRLRRLGKFLLPLVALAGDVGAFRRRLVVRLGAELVEASLDGVGLRRQAVEDVAQRHQGGIDALAHALQVGIRQVAAGERGLRLVEIGPERIDARARRIGGRVGSGRGRLGRRAGHAEPKAGDHGERGKRGTRQRAGQFANQDADNGHGTGIFDREC